MRPTAEWRKAFNLFIRKQLFININADNNIVQEKTQEATWYNEH